MVSHPTFLYLDSPKVEFHDSQLLCSWPEQCAGEDHIRDILSLWHYLDPNPKNTVLNWMPSLKSELLSWSD